MLLDSPGRRSSFSKETCLIKQQTLGELVFSFIPFKNIYFLISSFTSYCKFFPLKDFKHIFQRKKEKS